MIKQFSIFVLLYPFFLFAQQLDNEYVIAARVVDGDTLPLIDEPPVKIWGERVFSSASERQKFDRMARHVKKVYPYAKIAGQRYREYVILLSTIENEKEQKRIMKKAEDEIKAEFYNDIRDMTFTQGKILLKLIYRETEHTSYQLLQDFRGQVRATFWQGVARIFGANLKATFEPEGEDKYIEEIIMMIENGAL